MERQLIVNFPRQVPNHNQMPEVEEGPYMAFKGRVFPLLAFIVGFGSIVWTYQVAVSKSPPDVKPFPWTDITHTGIHYPEYIILRIGLMVVAPLFTITFQLLKNYLEIKSFQIIGQQENSLNNFGMLSTIACIALCVSTATISDGGDMNWTVHTIGATGFFLIVLYLIMKASKVYRKLWPHKRGFCPTWSYNIKKYSNFIILSIVVLELQDLLQVVDIGSFTEWYVAFYVMFFALTLYWDMADMEIVFSRS